MNWYQYVACFCSGMFLANFVPHFINGVSGDPFPTPFANPPGKGLSSPLMNVLWALFNLAIGYILFRAGNVADAGDTGFALLFAGVAALSIPMSIRFASKDKA